MWLGADNGGTKWFQVKEDYDITTESRKKIVNGIKYFSMGSIMWFTNLDHGRRHQILPLMTMADNLKYSNNLRGKTAYDRYDNYDAIEVGTYKEIPSDYDGAMGVPITFLDKYNPDQFEIIGCFEGGTHGEQLGSVKSVEISSTGRELLWNGPIVNRTRLYKRIVIRHRFTRSAKATNN